MPIDVNVTVIFSDAVDPRSPVTVMVVFPAATGVTTKVPGVKPGTTVATPVLLLTAPKMSSGLFSCVAVKS